MLSAFALTNCTQEIENPALQPESAGYPFEIVASTVDTKTVNDGMHTKWAANDQINLFHAVTGDTTYVNDKAFKVTDVESGKFTGTLTGELDNQEEYDWYAFYPYTSQITTPANKASYVTVASKATGVQTQNGNNSMAHIAGVNYPIAGKAYTTPAGSTPELEMKHITSLLEVIVTNATEEPLTVTEIILNAPELLVGTFYVNFAGDITPASFVSSGESYTAKTAKLAVNNGEAISKGTSAKFYLAVKPFDAEAGETLELYVNGSVKEIELSKEVSFTAGKIKTINYTYEAKASAPESVTVAEFLEKEVNAAVWYQLTGVVSNIVNTQYGNFDLVDETGTVYVYGLTQTKVASNNQSFSKIGLKEGDVVTLIGTRAEYNKAAQVGGPAYYVSHTAAPFIDVEQSVSVDADVTTYSINVKSNTAWTATASEGVTLDKTSGNGDAVVVMSFAANTTSEPITYTVTFETEDSSETLTLTQKGVPAAGEPIVVFEESFSKFNGTMGWSGDAAQGKTVTADNDGWTFANVYGAGGSAKFGTSSKKGSAQTPALNFTGNATLTFKAGAWNGSKEVTTLNLTMTGGTLSKASVTLVKGAWTEYEVIITGATPDAQITFAAKNASNNRFFLDDIKITQ